MTRATRGDARTVGSDVVGAESVVAGQDSYPSPSGFDSRPLHRSNPTPPAALPGVSPKQDSYPKASIPPVAARNNWVLVSRESPCPVCKHADWCSVSADGALAACRRVEAGCWRSKTDRAGTPVYLHRLDGEALPPNPPLPPPSGTAPERSHADTLHCVFSALLPALTLSPAHP